MNLRVRIEAGLDASDAAVWYEAEEAQLGRELTSEIRATLERIAAGPKRYQIYYRGLRRALVRRFSFSVYYLDTDTEIVVFAVLHQSRDLSVLDGRLESG